MYLAMQRPPKIDSAYALAQKYRIAEQTAKECLRSNGYKYEETAWVRHSTQLDDIEQKLDVLLTLFQRHLRTASTLTPGGSLSEQIAAEKLDLPNRSQNGRGHGLAPTSWTNQG